MRPTRASLGDVAAAAGVGRATVSRALNGMPDVSDDTRRRVREAAERLGYRPSATARALRSGTFRAISVIVPDQVWGWWEPVLAAASRAASEAGFHLLVHPIAGYDGGLAAVIDSLHNVPTEGVIVVSVPDQAAVRQACERIGLPVVAIDDTADEVHLPSVAADNRDGARVLVEHLIGLGRTKIVCVGARGVGFAPTWGKGFFIDERLEGYRAALAAAGLSAAERILDWPTPGDESAEREEEIEALFAAGEPPDAVFCVADLIAAPVLRSLSALGVRVPEDVAVAGFDDERAAVLLNPQLTTIRQPYDLLGRSAVDLLLTVLAGETLSASRHVLPVQLVVRASTSATPSRRPSRHEESS